MRFVAKHNSSKTGSRRQSRKKTISKHFLKQFLKGKLLAPKLGKFADKSLSQPGCSHSNTIYDVQLQKRQYSITHAAAARSNLDAATTMRSAATELQNTIELRATASETAAPKPDLDAKAEKRRFWSTFKKYFWKENCNIQKGLVAPRGGSSPWNSRPQWLFSRGAWPPHTPFEHFWMDKI